MPVCRPRSSSKVCCDWVECTKTGRLKLQTACLIRFDLIRRCSAKAAAHGFQPAKLNAHIGRSLRFRLGAVSHTDSGRVQHRNIIGAITHRQHLLRLQAQHVAVLQQ